MKKISLLLLIFLSCSDKHTSSDLPGRLGNPEMSLTDDPRAIPAVTKVMSEYGLDALVPDPPISIDATQNEKVEYMTSLEPVYEEIFKSWYSDLPEIKGLERFTKVIEGVDGNEITLGGLKLKSKYKLLAHSDGDVLLHSITDAILGATNKNDIGVHFPPSKSKYKNSDSVLFLNRSSSNLLIGCPTIVLFMFISNSSSCASFTS